MLPNKQNVSQNRMGNDKIMSIQETKEYVNVYAKLSTTQK